MNRCSRGPKSKTRVYGARGTYKYTRIQPNLSLLLAPVQKKLAYRATEVNAWKATKALGETRVHRKWSPRSPSSCNNRQMFALVSQLLEDKMTEKHTSVECMDVQCGAAVKRGARRIPVLREVSGFRTESRLWNCPRKASFQPNTWITLVCFDVVCFISLSV